MTLRLPLVLLLLSLANCSAKSWQGKQYARIDAVPGDRLGGAKSDELLQALDGLAHHLYTEAFLYQTSGSDLRPPKVFTGQSAFGQRGSFDAATVFVVDESSTQYVSCHVDYTDDKKVCVLLFQNHLTSYDKPRFPPLSAARRAQLDRLVKWTRNYLQKKLSSYRVTVSGPPGA